MIFLFQANFTPPCSYSKHISFIDFNEFREEIDFPMPIYMNFVREPVQRIISWYYYVRAPWYMFTGRIGKDEDYTYTGE